MDIPEDLVSFTIFNTYSSQESERVSIETYPSENVRSREREKHNSEGERERERSKLYAKTAQCGENDNNARRRMSPRDNVLKFAVALDKT